MDTSSTRYRAPMKKAQLTLSFMVKDWRLSPKTGNKVNLSALSRLPRWRLWLKNLTANAGDLRDVHSISGLERSPGRGHGNSLQYSCLKSPYGQRSLVGYSPWGLKESDTLNQLSTHTHTHTHTYTHTALITSIQLCTGSSSQSSNLKMGNILEKKKLKLSSFLNKVIVHRENLKELTKIIKT